MKRNILPSLLCALTICIQAQNQERPIDRNATEPTQQLYHYLRYRVWGKQILSGCQARWDYNTMDADGLYERTGTYRLGINKESGIYEKGERAVVTCHADYVPMDSLLVRVSYNNKVCREFRLLPATADFIVMEQALDSTCAVSVLVQERTNKPESIGYVVAPEGFRSGYEEPADLMTYWNDLKKQLKALPMQVKTTPLDVPEQYKGKYTCQDLEINCLGPAPVRAYVAKPINAKGKKTINCVPYRTHAWPSGILRPQWEEHYLRPREAFINDYLK